MDVVLATVRRKGWTAVITHVDEAGWQYATVSLERKRVGRISLLGPAQGSFDITIDTDRVHIEPSGNLITDGIGALKTAVNSELGKLPWLESTRPNPSPKSEPLRTAAGPIFVVHGSDNERKQEIARFLNLTTTRDIKILHEQANQGRTLIEKFEEHAAEAAFAVVLLTPDDRGGIASGSNLQPRARQNVVFELGFFFGKHGRSRVAVLYDETIELPSDVAGIAYIPMDSFGAWKLQLAKELNAASIPTDLGKSP